MSSLATPTAHATTTRPQATSWSPLKIGVMWTVATTGSGLAGLVITLWFQLLFLPYWNPHDQYGALGWLILIMVGGFLVFSLVLWGQSQVLVRNCGSAGWAGWDTAAWVLATIGGSLVGLVVGMLLTGSALPALLFSIFVAGLCVGGAQAFVLRRYMPHAAYWVAANIVGWLGGGIAADLVSRWAESVVVLHEMVACGIGLLVLGPVTGWALAWLLPAQSQVAAPEEGSETPRPAG